MLTSIGLYVRLFSTHAYRLDALGDFTKFRAFYENLWDNKDSKTEQTWFQVEIK